MRGFNKITIYGASERQTGDMKWSLISETDAIDCIELVSDTHNIEACYTEE